MTCPNNPAWSRYERTPDTKTRKMSGDTIVMRFARYDAQSVFGSSSSLEAEYPAQKSKARTPADMVNHLVSRAWSLSCRPEVMASSRAMRRTFDKTTVKKSGECLGGGGRKRSSISVHARDRVRCDLYPGTKLDCMPQQMKYELTYLEILTVLIEVLFGFPYSQSL